MKEIQIMINVTSLFYNYVNYVFCVFLFKAQGKYFYISYQ